MVRKVLVAALVAVARAASNDAGAPVPFAEFAAPADKADGAGIAPSWQPGSIPTKLH